MVLNECTVRIIQNLGSCDILQTSYSTYELSQSVWSTVGRFNTCTQVGLWHGMWLLVHPTALFSHRFSHKKRSQFRIWMRLTTIQYCDIGQAQRYFASSGDLGILSCRGITEILPFVMLDLLNVLNNVGHFPGI